MTQGSKEEKQVMEGGDSPGRPAVLPLGGARGLWEQVGLWSKLDSGRGRGAASVVVVENPHIWEATESQTQC